MEQLTFPNFDLSSGFNCDVCKDCGWHTPTDYEPYACLCEFGHSITCPKCGIIYTYCRWHYCCACCGEDALDLNTKQKQAILDADNYYERLMEDDS